MAKSLIDMARSTKESRDLFSASSLKLAKRGEFLSGG